MDRFVKIALPYHRKMLTSNILEEAKGKWLLLFELQTMEEGVHVQMPCLEAYRLHRRPEKKIVKRWGFTSES